MRSLLVALVLAAPVSAVASTPSYTSPVNTAHHAKAQTVYVTFVNHTSAERQVCIGNLRYTIKYNSAVRVEVPVGSMVLVSSNQDSKVNDQLTVSANDEKASIFLK